MASVLVVDDAAFMRMTIKQMLEPHGHVVVGEAENGIQAVEMFAELRPDIVIMDISMPEMNGIEALKRIKILDSEAKIVICTAIGQHIMLADAIENGAGEFMVKPFEQSQLIAAIDKLLK